MNLRWVLRGFDDKDILHDFFIIKDEHIPLISELLNVEVSAFEVLDILPNEKELLSNIIDFKLKENLDYELDAEQDLGE